MRGKNEINLTEILIDKKDYDKFNKFKWRKSTNGYIVRSYLENGKYKMVYLHRLIMNCPKGLSVDHINGNKLDNRKENLRVVTHRENMLNISKYKDKPYTSKYKGVGFHKQTNKYRARIKVHGKEKHLGMFLTEEEAALKYNEHTIKEFGEFAVLNKIEEEYKHGYEKIN